MIPSYGLRPRVWLLVIVPTREETRHIHFFISDPIFCTQNSDPWSQKCDNICIIDPSNEVPTGSFVSGGGGGGGTGGSEFPASRTL